MKQLVRQVTLLAAVLFVICLIWRLNNRNTYTWRVPYPAGQAGSPDTAAGEGAPGPQLNIEKDEEDKGSIRFGDPQLRGGVMAIPLRPEEAGASFYTVTLQDDGENPVYMNQFRVSPLGTIYDQASGGFTGDSVVMAALAVFFLCVSFLMIRFFLKARESEIYSYYMIYTSGFSVFSLVTGLVLLYALIRHLADPLGYSMRYAYSLFSSAPSSFMKLTLPLVVGFSVWMILSNLELLRHEKPRTQNLLGILAGAALMAGEALGLWLALQNFSGSEREYRIFTTVVNAFCTMYVYFECMLAGAVICGLRAAFHKPEPDRDYIVILGCRFRKDGTLTPLLQGRCDRGIAFWEEQKNKTGKRAVFIPSGGQGPDESMPEAEAMARYLLSRGIPSECIRREDQSRNTFQNMSFSKEIIEGEKADAKVAYATTNYHVFRSGVWARLAGLKAEGIGSPTKWWFWPNAFLRECVGLLVNRLRQEIVMFIVLLLFFAALSMALA